MNRLSSIGLTLVLLPALVFAQHQKQYFQQEVNYTIEVELDDEEHLLRAFEYVEYINHSHSRLDFIYFHLWPNAYKDNSTALARQLYENGSIRFKNAHDSLRGYIDSLNFTIDGKALKWEFDSVHSDICKVYLNEPLNPMERVVIATPFKVKIPGDFSRLGHVGQSYQISQWYPKPAVYDREGWHPMPYLDQGEFYSEYGSFDVRITLPKNYVVGATGDLQTREEVEWLNQRVTDTEKLTFSKDSSKKAQPFPPSDKERKKIRYIQKNVHDFAWFADKRYHVKKGRAGLPHSGDSVDTWVMFTDLEADLWSEGVSYLNDAIFYYSKWNGDYPYKQATAVQGALSAGGGMEYPNVTVINYAGDATSLDIVITHEIGHNWFYGILGFNERRYPALDEGINSFNEIRYMETKYPDLSLFFEEIPQWVKGWLNLNGLNHRDENYLFYLFTARKNTDQALLIPADEYTSTNYGAMVYSKMAISMQMIRAELGDSLFDASMQAFFNEWKFKHPGPEDLRHSLEKASGVKLHWFFDDYLHTTHKIDQKVKGLKHLKNGEIELTVKNKEKHSAPLFISSMNANKVINTYRYESLTDKRKIELPNEGATHYMLDGEKDLVEVNRNNNWVRSKGLFKKFKPLQFRLLTSLERPDKTQLFVAPILGWNSSDELMAGLALHNKSLIEKKFEYVLAPMYSFHRNDLTGIGDLSYHWYAASGFQRITANVNFQRFSYNSFFTSSSTTIFNRYYPKLNFDIKPKRERSRSRTSFQIASIFTEETTQTDGAPIVENNNIYPELTLRNKLNAPEWSLNSRLFLQGNDNFSKMSLTSVYRKSYNRKRNRFTARFFWGAFLFNETNDPRYNWRMDGPTGYHDYTFSTVMPDRQQSMDVWRNQMINQHGAFKTPTAVGQSYEWITALNLKAELPVRFPLGFFADMGYSPANVVEYSGGAYLRVVRDVFEVYFPFLWSENIRNADETIGRQYGDKIRFVLNLSALDPYKLIQPKNL